MAREFNGSTSNYLQGSPPLTAQPLTVACWFWVDDISVDRALQYIGKSSGGTPATNLDTFVLFVSAAAGTLQFAAVQSGTQYVVANGGAVSTGQWNHAAGSYDGSTARVYLNGTEATASGSWTPTGIDIYCIGIANDTTPDGAMDGRISHAAVWNAVLLQREITALANRVSPTRVRRGNLISFHKLYGDESPERNRIGTTFPLTVNGTVPKARGAPVQIGRLFIPGLPTPPSTGGEQKTVADTGAGADDVAIGANVPIAETGGGDDETTVQAELEVAESGSGDDQPAVGAQLGVAESGAGADEVALIQTALKSVLDSAAGSDEVVVGAELAVAEAGTGADSPAVAAELEVADTGAGADAPSVEQPTEKSVADAGTGTDEPSVSATLGVDDSGAGADAPSVTQSEIKTVPDAGSGAEAVEIPARTLPVADSGSGAETPAISVELSVGEDGSGADAPSVGVELAVSDTASAEDFVAVLKVTLKAVADAAAGSDQVGPITALITVPDVAIGADQVAQILAELGVEDTATGVETIVSSGLGGQVFTQVKVVFHTRREVKAVFHTRREVKVKF